MNTDSQMLRLGTQGWDMVSCAVVPDLNTAIAGQHSTPPGFEGSDSGATAKGRFADWQVGNEGSGELVHLTLPMRDVTIGYEGNDWTVAGATAHVELNLRFVPKDVVGLADGIQLFDLCVDPAGASGVEVLPVTVEEGRDDATTRAIIKLCLTDWLMRNPDAFGHVFATIQVWSEASEKEHPWLKPTSKGYAFCSLDDPARSFLAVLAQTQQRSDKTLIYQVSPDTLVQPYERSIMISHQRFARDMLLPALLHSFPGLRSQDLRFENNETRITLVTPRAVKGVDVKNKTYSVVLQQMDIELLEDGFELTATTQSEVSPGIYSNCRTSGRYTVALVDRPDGRQTLGIRQLAPITEPRHWSSHAEWVDNLEDFLWLLSLVGIAVLAFLTEGVGAVVAIIVICLILGGPVASVTVKMIEDVHKNDAPPLDLLIADAAAAVSWPSVDGFVARAIDIVGGVRISGFARSTSYACG
jgi:Clostridium P-47 protein